MSATNAFPNRDSLCERCGYPLQGLNVEGDCPECGLTIIDSSPAHRTGPPWQRHMAPGSWFVTLYALVRHPKHMFRTMSFDGSNRAPQMFLLSIAMLMGVYWFLYEWVRFNGLRYEASVSWLLGAVAVACAVAGAVLVLTYVEIIGVAFFSRQRGWRVGFHNSERIACYASPGWSITIVLISVLANYWATGSIDGVWTRWIGPWSSFYALSMGALVFSLAILGFETLVWLGVRQAKYANRMHPIVLRAS